MAANKNDAKNLGFVELYLRLIGFVTAFLGLALLFWPHQISGLFFNNTASSTDFFTSITGSTLIGYSALNLLASRRIERELEKIAVWGNLTTLLIASIVTIIYYAKFDSYGWLIISQHVFFGTGFVICAVKIKNP